MCLTKGGKNFRTGIGRGVVDQDNFDFAFTKVGRFLERGQTIEQIFFTIEIGDNQGILHCTIIVVY